MAHLLEKQYKRGERARKKNKQEERKMVHEISGKNGLRALHEYRVEMVTREQRKVAEELERIREGLRMSRWNAGAKHKEAKRGLQLAAIATPRREEATLTFSSAKPVAHHHRGKTDALSSRFPPTVPGHARAVKSGPFSTSRRPAPGPVGQDPTASGTVSNPVSGRHEKGKIPRLQLRHARDSIDREDAVTSSRSLGYGMGDTGRGDASSDDSDSDNSYDSDDDVGDRDAKNRPPHPDILKAILQGVVQCWEETVATAADPTSVKGDTSRPQGGEVPSTATSLGDFLSPRGLGDKRDNLTEESQHESRKRSDNALSLVLLRNMKANNLESKKQVLEKGSSSSSVNSNRVGETTPSNTPRLFSKVQSGDLGDKPTTGRRRRLSNKGQHALSHSRLSASSRHSDDLETVEEYVANINKDLPKISETADSTGSQKADPLASSINIHSSSSSTSRKTKLPPSAHSNKSSKVTESARSTDRASQRSYGRHVRTMNVKDSKKQTNQSRHGSASSTKSERFTNEAARPDNQNLTSAQDRNEDGEEDDIPPASFRLPPLKKVSKSGKNSNGSKSARSSVTSIHSGRASPLSDARNNSDDNKSRDSNNNNSNSQIPLPRLSSAAEPSPLSTDRSRRGQPPTTLPRLPLSASVSSTPRMTSQTSTSNEGDDHSRINNSTSITSIGETSKSTNNELSLDLNGKKSNSEDGIRYKKKIHVYQKSPRGNN